MAVELKKYKGWVFTTNWKNETEENVDAENNWLTLNAIVGFFLKNNRIYPAVALVGLDIL